MRTIETIKDGYTCSAAALADGWLACVLVLENVDEHFIERPEGGPPALRAGKTEGDWMAAVAGLKREVVAVRCRAGAVQTQPLSQADRIAGTAAAGGAQPALAWCGRHGELWRLMLWRDGAARPLAEREGPLARPACAWINGRLLIAYEVAAADADQVEVRDGDGERLSAVEGRRPHLASTADGSGVLVVERVESRDAVRLHAFEATNGGLGAEIPLPSSNDYNFNAHLAYEAADGTLYVVHESCPTWGIDHRVGRHREIRLWALPRGAAGFQPAPGTCRAELPLPREAHWDLSYHNMTPIFPRVLAIEGRPAVAYRRAHFSGHRSFGWHTFLAQWDGSDWTEPVRISEHIGIGDADYEVLFSGRELLAFLPSCEATPAVTHEEAAAGQALTARRGRSRQGRNLRVEVVAVELADPLPALTFPTDKSAPYVIPPHIYGLCPDPPRPEGIPQGLKLVWGDLHPHTAYSKCMAPDDGFPVDQLRFKRDVMGCEVLCLVDHTGAMGLGEHAWVYDQLEIEAGQRCVIVYGAEPGCRPAHHINFYAIDRETFDRFRELTFFYKQQQELFARIKREFRPGSILPVRHGHGVTKGEFGLCSPRTVELFDPELEVAMEAMQLRGDMMWELNHGLPGYPLFPNNFLSAGARIGLLGGTDHSNPARRNHFCLTGFWVRQVTAEAIFDAIKRRKTIATSNAKAAIYAELDGQPMGEEVAVRGAVCIRARVSAGTSIHRVCLMRDGQLLPWHDIGAKQATVTLVDEAPPPGYHWYVVTAQAGSVVARQPATAHASPFFVTVN